MGNRTGSTGGGEDVLLLIGQAEGLCQMGRHGGAEARVALTGAVAVKGDRLFLGQQGLHGFGVDPELIKTFNKLGIPLEEQMALSGMAVDAVLDSVSCLLYTSKDIYKKMIITAKTPKASIPLPIMNCLFVFKLFLSIVL